MYAADAAIGAAQKSSALKRAVFAVIKESPFFYLPFGTFQAGFMPIAGNILIHAPGANG
jgi:hypothetical protein